MAQRLISADDHVDVTHDKVKGYLASRHHADYDDAVAAFGQARAASMSSDSNQRWRRQQGLDVDPAAAPMMQRRHPANGRPGHTDPVERLRDMDADGVDVSSSYCEVSAFRYLYLVRNGWREATRAFNSALGEFASADPRRLVVSYQIPIHDIEVAVEEVRAAAAEGCKSLQLPVFPAELGLPDYWDEVYDPLWAAIQDVDLPICCHIGLNTQLEGLAQRDPTPQKGVFVPMTALSTGEALGMWVLTGVLERFPALKVVFVEPGIGWVSWWLYIVDDLVRRQGYDFPGLSELPSFYFRRNVYLTFVDEPDVVRHAHDRLGIHNIMWSSDYPHPVSSWPRSRDVVDTVFTGVSDEDRRLVVSENAARVWKL
ncbi:MAG: amidohydrolase family protein [Acidobacteriota bacterium]|nr:amidohydrolase family protein [Acidobacteriota bacterium]